MVPQKGEREGERSQLKRKRGTREDYTTIALAKRENGTRTKWDKELQRYQKSGDEKKQVCSCARKTRESRLGGTEKRKINGKMARLNVRNSPQGQAKEVQNTD